jgi:hypothetical protein
VATKVKILLPNFPRELPRDVKEKVRQLTKNPDYFDEVLWEYRVEEIPVQTIRTQSQLLALIKEKDANVECAPFSQVVIVSLIEKDYPDLIERLHLASRNLTVLGVSPDKENLYVEQLCPKRRQLANTALQNIGDTLREAVLFAFEKQG